MVGFSEEAASAFDGVKGPMRVGQVLDVHGVFHHDRVFRNECFSFLCGMGVSAIVTDHEVNASIGDGFLDGLKFFHGHGDGFFDEDVFADDFMAELGGTEPGNTSDVDELLKSFGGQELDIDGGWGITVDAFPAESEATNEQATAVREHIESITAESDGVAAKQEYSEWFLPVGIRFDYTSQSSSEVFKDFLDAFLEEGALELEKLEDAMGEWENDINNATAFAPIPRVLHNLKGIAKGVGLQRYGTLVHNFETLLDKMPKAEEQETEAYFRVVNAWLDAAVRGFARAFAEDAV